MAREFYNLPTIQMPLRDVGDLRREVNVRLQELNRVLGIITRTLALLQGTGVDSTPHDAHINMQGFRVTNASHSRGLDDYVTRRELVNLGVYPGRAQPITFSKAMNVPTLTVDGSQVLSEADIVTLITNEVDSQVPSIADGAPIDLEDFDGTDGATGGMLLFALQQEASGPVARPLRNSPSGMLLADRVTHELLTEIRDLLSALVEKL